jgi:2-(3-amino-3-carboxypropyl)histidine synthase
MYDFKKILKTEIDEIKNKITPADAPIALQIPEGLKTKATFILEQLKEYKPLLFIDPCYGACDLKEKEAKELGCKVLVHFGHYPMGKPKLKTIFVPIGYKLNITDINFIIEEISKKYKHKKINLLTTAQYLNNIETIKKKLSKEGIIVEPMKKTKRVEKHMVLGCDCSTVVNKESSFVFIGDGNFHARNISFKYNKEIFIINPITKETKVLEKDDRFLRQRYGVVGSLKNAKRFGIVVSTKKGQNRHSSAKEIYDLLLKHNKAPFIFCCDEFRNDSVIGIDVDCFINTACPRITYDDYKNYCKPVITIEEAKLLLKEEKELKIDQIN